MAVRNLLSSFWGDVAGATAIEYSLIASFVGLAIITAAQALGIELGVLFTDVTGGLQKRPKI